MRRPGRSLVAALLLAPAVAVVGAAAPSLPAAAEFAPSRFQPVPPTRLADTRQTDCGCTHVDASTIRVQIAGRGSIPPDAVAAAVTITSDATRLAGYVTVSPSGAPRPLASVLNTEVGAARANSTIVPLGTDGAIELFTSSATQLIVDVTGVFLEAATARAGRFVAVTPQRLVDTRTPPAPLAPGGSITVGLPRGVAADATAVAVNVTVTDPGGGGYLTAFPAGSASDTSFLNVGATDSQRAAAVIVPVSSDGFTIASSTSAHVLVDLVGWFTGSSAPVSSDGLFVPTTPTRVLDTRQREPRLHPRGTVEVAFPAGAQAVVTNLTVTRSDAAGYLTAYPAGTARPEVSAVNTIGFDTTVPNLAITPVTTRGVAYYSHAGSDLVVDQMGWFTGAAAEATEAPAPNPVPPRRVLLVGDSSMAGMRWYGQAATALQGFDAVLDAESCRRMSTPSCMGRENRIPSNAVEAILSKQMWFDVVVIQVGYNDWFDDFGAMMGEVMSAARARGAEKVIWLTYRDVGGTISPSARRAYGLNNISLRAVAASGVHPDLVVADWRQYTINTPSWFVADGVHYTLRGAYGEADYISRYVAHLYGEPCPQPSVPGGAIAAPCPNPDTQPTPDVLTLYGAADTQVHCYEFGPDRIYVCTRDILLPR